YFFFQAEDGIRDFHVTGVQTCALPISEGETLGLVGESGCGKSTTGRAIMQLPPPTSGRVRFGDVELTGLKGEALRARRPQLQMRSEERRVGKECSTREAPNQ